MSKRLIKKYKLLRFYEEDLWGQLEFHPTFKKVKINRIFYKEKEAWIRFQQELAVERERCRRVYHLDSPAPSEAVRRRRYAEYKRAMDAFTKSLRRMRFKAPFNFRIDKGRPRRQKRVFKSYAVLLRNRHQFLKFSTQAMNVHQFRGYLRKIRRGKASFINFYRFMESRVDTLVFRLNFAETAGEARQLVNHRNFLINGQVVGIPSDYIEFGDVFSVKDKEFFRTKVLESFKKKRVYFNLPVYLEINFRILSAILFMWPTQDRVSYFSASGGRKLNKNLASRVRLLAAAGPRMTN